ncbi:MULTISPECIES: zf-HC2 domain-containing protein [unclassified Streptomyces]|uniref:zf-HC2 domain-containing protein n=1 Tax=unclassified Streptomyces TaxID=2593676 RepID=UPI0036FDE063
MAGDLTCEQVRELSAELALGVLAGRERARAIAHLDRCADCREHVRQLTLVGDRLIGLLPDREPPVGFETRVARRLAHQVTAAQGPGPVRATGAARLGFGGRAHRRRLRTAAVATALTVAAGFAGWGVGTAVEAATAPPAPAVRSEPMLVGSMTAAGHRVGEVYAHPGSPGWIFVSLRLPAGAGYTGKVTCVLQREDGTTVVVGDFHLRDGRAEWGAAVRGGGLSTLSDARLTSSDGRVLATAELHTGRVLTPSGSEPSWET